MALTIAGSSLTSRAYGSAVCTADDDHAGCRRRRRRLREGCSSVVSGLRCELVERDVCRELLMNGVRNTVELPECGDGESRTSNVADHGHDLDRFAVGVLLVPFAEEQARDGWAGGLVWSFDRGWAVCSTLCSAGARSLCLV
jgi:hypothetical protein